METILKKKKYKRKNSDHNYDQILITGNDKLIEIGYALFAVESGVCEHAAI